MDLLGLLDRYQHPHHIKILTQQKNYGTQTYPSNGDLFGDTRPIVYSTGRRRRGDREDVDCLLLLTRHDEIRG